jgi:hypothetical protein
MAVMARETWTDERMDDLAKRVDDGFERVHGEIAELRAIVERDRTEARLEQKTATSEFRGEVKAVGDSLNQRFDAMQRTLMAIFGTMFVAALGVVVSLVS